MFVTVVHGDLLTQPVDAIVNSWNRNTIPWWLLLPQGVSGAIKRRAGIAPFKEVLRHGRLALGQAVATGAGRLPYKAIIHVAGINDFWRAGEFSIRASVRNAAACAESLNLSSLAMPIIGAGSSGFNEDRSLQLIENELEQLSSRLEIRVVRYRAGS